MIEAHHVPEVAVAWQGGEPMLMGLDFFEGSIEDVEKVSQAGDDDGIHDPDQWHTDRRRVGGLLQAARLPGRDQHRRPVGDA